MCVYVCMYIPYILHIYIEREEYGLATDAGVRCMVQALNATH